MLRRDEPCAAAQTCSQQPVLRPKGDESSTARPLVIIATRAWAIFTTGPARAAFVNVVRIVRTPDLVAVATVLALVSTDTVAALGDALTSLQFWLRSSQNLAAKRKERKRGESL